MPQPDTGRGVRGVLPRHLATAVPHDVRRRRRPVLAEDALQSAFAKAYTSWDAGPGGQHPEAYVRRMAVNEVLSVAAAPVVPRRAVARDDARPARRAVATRAGPSTATRCGGRCVPLAAPPARRRGAALLRGPLARPRSPTSSAAAAAPSSRPPQPPRQPARPRPRRDRPRGDHVMSEPMTTLELRAGAQRPPRRRHATPRRPRRGASQRADGRRVRRVAVPGSLAAAAVGRRRPRCLARQDDRPTSTRHGTGRGRVPATAGSTSATGCGRSPSPGRAALPGRDVHRADPATSSDLDTDARRRRRTACSTPTRTGRVQLLGPSGDAASR